MFAVAVSTDVAPEEWGQRALRLVPLLQLLCAIVSARRSNRVVVEDACGLVSRHRSLLTTVLRRAVAPRSLATLTLASAVASLLAQVCQLQPADSADVRRCRSSCHLLPSSPPPLLHSLTSDRLRRVACSSKLSTA